MALDRYPAPTAFSHSFRHPTTNYSRPPLADTNGNSHYKQFVLPGIPSVNKPSYHPSDHNPTRYQPRPIPSQETDLQRRRHHIDKARIYNEHDRDYRPDPAPETRPSDAELKRNILGCEEFKAYRAKNKENTENKKLDEKDPKWPDELENHMIDALLMVPHMGRVKYNLGRPKSDGKDGALWGRNELIAHHLEVASNGKYVRTRKEVSSHIQVLKSKMQHYPWFKWVIPPARCLSKEAKEAETRRMKKNNLRNPVLAALRHGTVPHLVPVVASHAIKPCSFELCMTTHAYEGEPTGYNISKPGSLTYQPLDTKETVPPNLLRNVPQIKRASAGCDIIHIRASLNLHPPSPGAELHGGFTVSLPADQENLHWRCSVTVNKHKDLCGAPQDDEPVIDQLHVMKPLKSEAQEGNVCLRRVHFPVRTWTHALGRLADMQRSFDEGRQEGLPSMSAREYIEQMSMCQEIWSSADGNDWEKRAIFAWTFTKTSDSESANTWSYIPTNEHRTEAFEPQHNMKHEASLMTESFSNLYNPNTLGIQTTNFDCMSYGPTPPLTATSQHSPYTQYPYTPQNDIVGEDMSFLSQPTHPGGDVLGDQHNTSQQINQFLQTDEALSMSFDQNSHLWQTQPQMTSYEHDANFLPSFNILPPLDPNQAWERNEAIRHEQWNNNENVYAYDTNAYGQAK